MAPFTIAGPEALNPWPIPSKRAAGSLSLADSGTGSHLQAPALKVSAFQNILCLHPIAILTSSYLHPVQS